MVRVTRAAIVCSIAAGMIVPGTVQLPLLGAPGPTTSASAVPRAELTIARDLETEMDALSKERPVSVHRIDELLGRTEAAISDPSTLARFYYRAAVALWSSGSQPYDAAIQYAVRAQELPLGPRERSHVHIVLGDLVQWAHRGAQGAVLADGRKRAATEYLKAMALVAAARNATVPEMPADPTEPTQSELVMRVVKAREEHRDATRKWDSSRSQVVALYSRPLLDTAELRELALAILGDTAEVDSLVRDVGAETGKRGQ